MDNAFYHALPMKSETAMFASANRDFTESTVVALSVLLTATTKLNGSNVYVKMVTLKTLTGSALTQTTHMNIPLFIHKNLNASKTVATRLGKINASVSTDLHR